MGAVLSPPLIFDRRAAQAVLAKAQSHVIYDM